MKMNDFMNLNKPRRRQILEVLLQYIIVIFSLLIPICIPNHYYYHYCQAFEGLSRLSCWLSLPPLILLTPLIKCRNKYTIKHSMTISTACQGNPVFPQIYTVD